MPTRCHVSPQDAELLDSALGYARRGWPVFPLHTATSADNCSCGQPNCPSPGKHPRTRHGVNDATTDKAAIRSWWTRWPGANIGIATGASSGIVVLDRDDGKGGTESLQRLEAAYGDLPVTPVVRTGGGLHLYFRRPPGNVRNKVALSGFPGFDVRADGGYVVAPPSLHVSQRRYRWEASPDEIQVAEMPPRLIALLTDPAYGVTDQLDHEGGGKIPEGQRNATLTSLAGAMRRRGMTPASIEAALLTENKQRCDPPLPTTEVARIVRSVARYQSSANSANYANREGDSSSWDPPTPFHEFDLPPFPTDALPEPIRTFVEAEAVATQTPPDLAAMLALAAIAAAAARKVRIQIKEGYSEPLNIFTVIALPPATRKSAVFANVTAPLMKYEKEEAIRMAPEIGVARTRYEIAEKRLKRAQEQAAKTSEPCETLEAEHLARELSTMSVPASPRLIADDATPEKLATLIHEQDGRMAVMSPEGGVFDLMAGRYSQNGAPNFEVYLKGHQGDTLRVDRVGRSSEHVERPALTLGLAVQPKVLEGLVARADFHGRGLLGRFLYARPRSLVGWRDVEAPSVPAKIRAAYHDCLAWLLGISPETGPSGESQEHALHLHDEARALLREAERWIEPQLAEFGELGGIQDWGGKWFGAVARITGLLHLVQCFGEAEPWRPPVPRQTVQCALDIGRYLIPHAKAAYAAMGADPAVEDAKHILKWIRHRRRESFTKRDVFEGTKGRFNRVSALEPGLRVLEEHGHVRQRAAAGPIRPGRPPSPVYDVNPDAHSQNSHNSQNDARPPDSANTANSAKHPNGEDSASDKTKDEDREDGSK